MRPKKGATISSRPKTEEVTRGRRKAHRRVVDQRQTKRYEAEERCNDEQWIKEKVSDMKPKKGASTSSGSKTEEVT